MTSPHPSLLQVARLHFPVARGKPAGSTIPTSEQLLHCLPDPQEAQAAVPGATRPGRALELP